MLAEHKGLCNSGLFLRQPLFIQFNCKTAIFPGVSSRQVNISFRSAGQAHSEPGSFTGYVCPS
uniref:Uncharacterized protein n=1 Tax=Anguilla anguilla TaxID=7936 RepID=A0A0E9WZH9_ANGAN